MSVTGMFLQPNPNLLQDLQGVRDGVFGGAVAFSATARRTSSAGSVLIINLEATLVAASVP